MKTSKNVIKAAIIDDEPAAIEVLEKGLGKFPDVSVMATGSRAADIEGVLAKKPDILFLDVELKDESSLDELARIDRKLTEGVKIVIYSSYRHYLLQAMRVKAFDFLLKPFDSDQLNIVMKRFEYEREHTAQASAQPVALAPVAQNQPLAFTTVTNERRVVGADRIVYFRYDSSRKVWEAVLYDMTRMLLRSSTTAEAILNSSPLFIRTHKVYIVNISYIGLVTANGCELIPPYDNCEDIKVSKNYRRGLLDKFYDI